MTTVMPVASICGRSSAAEIELTLLLSVIEWLPGPAALSCSMAQRIVPAEPSSAVFCHLKVGGQRWTEQSSAKAPRHANRIIRSARCP